MKVTKEQLKKMIREAVREQLAEQVQAATWGAQNTPKGLAGFAGKTGAKTFQSNAEKAKKAQADKEAMATAKTADAEVDKTVAGGKAAQGDRQKIQQARDLRKLQGQVQSAVSKMMSDPNKLKALIQFIQSQQAS